MQSIRDVRSGALEPGKARAVNDLAQTLINSAKVEIEFARVTKRNNSQFLGSTQQPKQSITANGQGVVESLPAGGPWSGLTHTMRD